MKNLILYFGCTLICTIGLAQESTKTNPPQIITKLKIGQMLQFENHTIKFASLTEDNRCPSDVSCFWEGEAKASIEVYKNQKLVEQKQLIIRGTGGNPKTKNKIFGTDIKAIYAYNISPYPISTKEINNKEYTLELIVK